MMGLTVFALQATRRKQVHNQDSCPEHRQTFAKTFWLADTSTYNAEFIIVYWLLSFFQ